MAERLTSLRVETLATAGAGGADRDFYVARAMLLNPWRNQMVSAG